MNADPATGLEMSYTPDADTPVPYMQRTRDWYPRAGLWQPLSLGSLCRRAVPSPLKKPLAQSTVALITTAAPFRPDKGNQGPGAAYNAAAKFFAVYSGDTAQDHDLRISPRRNRSQAHEHGGQRLLVPLPRLRELVNERRIGRLAQRFHGAPTNRSQRHTIEVDCPEILRRCQEDGVDVALLVPNCPIWSPEPVLGRAIHGIVRHRYRRIGVRERHRRACRRSARAIQ